VLEVARLNPTKAVGDVYNALVRHNSCQAGRCNDISKQRCSVKLIALDALEGAC
jgi:hypothetical protein